jgi:hypothetical protein
LQQKRKLCIVPKTKCEASPFAPPKSGRNMDNIDDLDILTDLMVEFSLEQVTKTISIFFALRTVTKSYRDDIH